MIDVRGTLVMGKIDSNRFFKNRTVFWPRDCSLARLQSRGLAVTRCLPGWLGVCTFVYCVETAKDTAIVATEDE